MLWLGSSGSTERLVTDTGSELFELGEALKSILWVCGLAVCLQTHAYDLIKGLGKEAVERVRLGAVR